ncbi:DUF3820 family protein [Akkermansia glycaniphila]|uniref:Putative quorum-sensing-regulated virulence factor n=1 Tax=Akkermansia glycaniphila TaxID=1679444 RepID=A0A1C7PDM4_9BACT|nr:DUF3820 family protein [Akkermansia glycaniphila]OCA03558.1 hypothetical protein AC781_03830 [Akkermansia glycaniphila]SEH74471.1 putative quorum-sensing-regulated virulence factor [Akkermansia glycaniphila]
MNEGSLPDAEQLRALLAEIAGMHMPFGMYGPAKYPPKGCPIMDLPEEYLGWFQQRGFPKGKLGQLMEQCWELRSNGMDHLFQPFRAARGGRTSSRGRRRSYDFPES